MVFAFGLSSNWNSNNWRAICWTDYPFPIELSWHFGWKSAGYIVWVLWDLSRFVYPNTNTHCFDYCYFIVSPEISLSVLQRGLFCQNCFDRPRYSVFYINLRSASQCVQKKTLLGFWLGLHFLEKYLQKIDSILCYEICIHVHEEHWSLIYWFCNVCVRFCYQDYAGFIR